jgi:DNA polymerase-3 subunit beta
LVDAVKLSVIQENLARGLQVVSRAVSARSTLPVLGNVLLRTEEGGLKLTATNLEIGVTYWVPAKVDGDGAITVPARLFTDFVNSLPNERIDLELQGESVEVHCGRYRAHLKGIDAEEFPAIPSAGERPTTRLAQKAQKESLGQVTFAAATDEARPILTGVLTRFSGDQLTLAAADNYRISVRTLTTMDPVEETSIVVPARSYVELSRILADSDDPVDIVLAPARNQVLFHVEGVDIVSRLIDGQFPNYQQILPDKHSTRAVVERAQLLEAVRLASFIASSSANVVKLAVPADGDGSLTITAAADIGDDQGQIEAAVEGDGTTIAFNARYLGDVLQNVSVDQIALEFNGPLSPGIFRPVGTDDYVHVIMPVRTAS